MKSLVSASVLALSVLFVAKAQADIQPAELVAGSVSFQGHYLVGHIYVGGTYGHAIPAGRTATLEWRVEGGPWVTLISRTLPELDNKGYYLTTPYANPVQYRTTFRLHPAREIGTPAMTS